MLASAAFIYGLALSVTLSMLGRNSRAQAHNPPLLVGLGYVLCGASLGISGALAMVAINGDAAVAGLSPLLL